MEGGGAAVGGRAYSLISLTPRPGRTWEGFCQHLSRMLFIGQMVNAQLLLTRTTWRMGLWCLAPAVLVTLEIHYQK